MGSPLFSPTDAVAEFYARRHAARATRLHRGNKPGTNIKKKPRKKPSDSYDVQSYGNAIAYACKKADVPVWSPNQLHHLGATKIRAAHGLEAAQVLLGHARADVTQIYAERDAQPNPAPSLFPCPRSLSCYGPSCLYSSLGGPCVSI